MSFTWNTAEHGSYYAVYSYLNSTGVASLLGALNTLASYDYFGDSAVAGDAIIFASSGYQSTRQRFRNIYLTVGTQLVASAITVAWEYVDEDGNWQELTGLTDNTNTFQNAGANSIIFTPPVDWKMGAGGISGLSSTYFHIRCRIVSVTSITEGGAQSSDLTNFGNNSLYVTGETTDDLMGAIATDGQADLEALGEDAYWLNCNLELGTGTYEILEQSVQILGSLKVNDTLKLGSMTDGVASQGSLLKIKSNGGYNLITGGSGKLYMYASICKGPATLGSDDVYLYNSIFQVDNSAITVLGNIITDDVLIVDGCLNLYDGVEIADIKFYGEWSSFYAPLLINNSSSQSRTATARRIQFLGGDYQVMLGYPNGVLYLVDPSGFDRAKASTASNAYLYLQWTFNLKVLDENGDPIENATVLITDGQANETELSTDENGEITEQELTEKRYTGAATTLDYSDYTLKVTKPGYRTYNFGFTLNQATSLILALMKPKHKSLSDLCAIAD